MRKKWRLRLSLALLLSSFLVLADEAVKEGYILDPADLINPTITHEKIFVVLLVFRAAVWTKEKVEEVPNLHTRLKVSLDGLIPQRLENHTPN